MVTYSEKEICDGLRLNQKSIQNRKRRHGEDFFQALRHFLIRRPKKTDDEYRRNIIERSRVKRGYVGDAVFDDYIFKETAAKRNGLDKYRVGKYNLHFVCKRIGASYNSTWVYLKRHPDKDAAEYLMERGYDVREFLYEET